jgi:15-cis-phytoene synthase
MSSAQLDHRLESNRQTIAKGSKSFYLASLFFTEETRDASWKLYRWCRSVDDRIDLAPDRETALARLSEVREHTENAMTTAATSAPEFAGLKTICAQYAIPKKYPLELIAGLEMDVAGHKYENLNQVELYSYRVAGVVGLMICYITGVSSPSAHRNAVDLGTAMQLTNIARDVKEDFALGRIYLPGEWLTEAGVSSGALMDVSQRDRVYSVVLRLLDRADQLYASGYSGLRYLPFRAALAVSIAGSIYSAIGQKIRAAGPSALERRTIVSLPEKMALVLKGTWRALRRKHL